MVITFIATKRSQHKNPLINKFCIYERKGGKYATVVEPATGRVSIYAPHFFKRYQERILKNGNLLKVEVIKLYFKNCWGQIRVDIDNDLEAGYL